MTNFDRIVSATVKTSGEVIEYHVRSAGEVTKAYQDVEARIEAYRQLKSALMNTGMQMLKEQDKGKT